VTTQDSLPRAERTGRRTQAGAWLSARRTAGEASDRAPGSGGKRAAATSPQVGGLTATCEASATLRSGSCRCAGGGRVVDDSLAL
jgi:hypothetical protein